MKQNLSARMFTVLIATTLATASGGCAEDDEEGSNPFQFDMVVNNYSNNEVTILVDDQAVSNPSQTVNLDSRLYPSYSAALSDPSPIRIATRADDAVIEACDVYPGACRDKCTPEKEAASVCIFEDGRIRLNTWDCPCEGETADWFCGGDCAITAP